MRAWLLVDLGFGDAGKGTITDALVRHTGAKWVIRYNGGAQAGHNVITDDGRHHTFSQFGSGSFVPEVCTYLTPKVIIHPSALLFEERHLQEVGVADALRRLHVASTCRVTTPFHQAAGRIRERARGSAAHGTCGVGVGETVRDALAHPDDILLAADLLESDSLLANKLERIRTRILHSLEARGSLEARDEDTSAAREWTVLRSPEVAQNWLELIERIRTELILESDAELSLGFGREPDLVFEGAQGVLLDEWQGFHPHTTWSTCTTQWAEEWLGAQGLRHEHYRLGIIRTYATRHGQGPFPSEARELRPHLSEPHNDSDEWQGGFRTGWPDPGLTRYAIAANGGIDALALTHLDRIDLVQGWHYLSNHGIAIPSPMTQQHSLARQRELGISLMQAKTTLAPLPALGPKEWIQWFEAQLGVPIAITSHGPHSHEKRFY